jgi:hypothetical protein
VLRRIVKRVYTGIHACATHDESRPEIVASRGWCCAHTSNTRIREKGKEKEKGKGEERKKKGWKKGEN